MLYNGSCVGKSGRRYFFNKGQEVQARKDEFTDEQAEMVKEPKKRGPKPKNAE